MANKTEHIKDEVILDALVKSLGIVTTACKQVGISRTTFYERMKDPEFKKKVDDVSDVALDFAESQLHKQIQSNNTSATIFYLKTKGKKRGYIERQEVDQRTFEIGKDPFKKIREVLDDTNPEAE